MAAILEQIEKVPVKQRPIILVVLVGLLAGAFYMLMYKPKADEIRMKTASLTQLNAEVQDLRIIEAKNKEFQRMIKELQDQLVAARQQLPGEKEIPKMLEEIARFGKESTVEFISFRPGAEIKRDFYNEVPMALAIRGPYHNIGVFLDKLSHYPRIISVSNLTMGSPTEKEGYLMLTSSCIATTYRYVEK
jgi:type IV pilus assembly protein PilO